MTNYENLVKLRKMIAEFKVYIGRTQTYLSPVQLFMIFIIFLNTTVWNVSAVQAFFGSKTNFIVLGTVIFVTGVLLVGYIDTRLKLFRAEQSRLYTPERNPFSQLNAAMIALLVDEKNIGEKRAAKIEKMLEPMMKETGIYEHYLGFKKAKKEVLN